MIKSINTGKQNLEYYSKAIKISANKNFIEFLKWFNGGDNITEITNKGNYDFFHSILKPYIFEQTKRNSKELICMEIGCGGGRLLNAACKYFNKAIGTDIHNNFYELEAFLKQENSNFELHRIKNNKFLIENNSVDFIYSFIVFQHILKISVFEDYLTEIKRVMNTNGLAIIYFGRPRFLSKKNFKYSFLNHLSVLFDSIFYETYLSIFRNGFFENYNAKVNHVNLVVSSYKAKNMFKNEGFKIIEKGRSKNKTTFGTQYYFIVKHN